MTTKGKDSKSKDVLDKIMDEIESLNDLLKLEHPCEPCAQKRRRLIELARKLKRHV